MLLFQISSVLTEHLSGGHWSTGLAGTSSGGLSLKKQNNEIHSTYLLPSFQGQGIRGGSFVSLSRIKSHLKRRVSPRGATQKAGFWAVVPEEGSSQEP